MEPGEALSTAAQIAVALAGFAGVVVVFRRESVHDWMPIDKFRLRFLLTNSILPLALCVIGLLLLTIEPVPTTIWRWCSGFAFVTFVLFAITTGKVLDRLDLRQLQNAHISRFVLYFFGTLGSVATLLQLYNIVVTGTFWPFFAGIAFQLIAAMVQFARIVLLPPEA
jgi:hypothetical protein